MIYVGVFKEMTHISTSGIHDKILLFSFQKCNFKVMLISYMYIKFNPVVLY